MSQEEMLTAERFPKIQREGGNFMGRACLKLFLKFEPFPTTTYLVLHQLNETVIVADVFHKLSNGDQIIALQRMISERIYRKKHLHLLYEEQEAMGKYGIK